MGVRACCEMGWVYTYLSDFKYSAVPVKAMIHRYDFTAVSKRISIKSENFEDLLIACCASLEVSKMTVPDPLGLPSAPMLISARMMFPADRKRSLRSCHPAWYGNYGRIVQDTSKAE